MMDGSFHQLNDAKSRALHLLTCPLCTQQYDDPRVLPCQHTFCCRCLVAHVNHAQSSAAGSSRLGAFQCPLCLADVGLPAAGASAFPVDKRIRNIRDLVVEEMAKDLASRLKGRVQGDGVCNGAEGSGDEMHSGRRGGVSASTRLGNITERSGVDDDDDDIDYGTWPSSARPQHSAGRTDPFYRTPSSAADDPAAFSRHKPGYSSMGAGSSAMGRNSRTDRPSTNDSDLRFSDFAHTPGETTSSGTGLPRFSRDGVGYSSARVARSRRERLAHDADSRSTYDRPAAARPFGNGVHPASRTPEPARKSRLQNPPSPHVEAASRPSPFDNINRDDDLSEPYTPIIGRHRLGFSSLRERRRRPVFDPSQLYDSPSDHVDDLSSSTHGSSRFGGGAGHRRDAGLIRAHTYDASELDDRLLRTVSSDQSWSRHTSDQHSSSEAKLHDEYEDGQLRSGGDEDVLQRKNRTGDKTRRQRPTSLDTSGLAVLSNLFAAMKMSSVATSQVSEPATTSASNHNHHSQPETRSDQPNDAAVRLSTDASESATSLCDAVVGEVPLASCLQNDVASQLNGCSSADADTTSDAAGRRHTGAMTSHSAADRSEENSVSRAKKEPPCPLDLSSTAKAGLSAQNTDETDLTADRQYSSSEEGRTSNASRSPTDSCFSRLSKFRASKNSRSSTCSTSPCATDAQPASKDAADCPPSPRLGEADATASSTSSKSRVCKRPPVFIGTPFSCSGSSVEDEAATSPSPIFRHDDVNPEPVRCDKEPANDGRLQLDSASVVTNNCDAGSQSRTHHDASESGSESLPRRTTCDNENWTHCTPEDVAVENVADGVCDTGVGIPDAVVKDRLQSVNGNEAVDIEDAYVDVETCSPDVSPTAERELSSRIDDDEVSRRPVERRQQEDDSAVYSDTASLRSATEPTMPTPTSDEDDDYDDALATCDNGEPTESTCTLSNQQDGPSDVITYHLRNDADDDDDARLSSSEAHHHADVMTPECDVRGRQGDGDAPADGGGAVVTDDADAGYVDSCDDKRSSRETTSDELHQQNDNEPRQPHQRDDSVNEDDDVTAPEQDGNDRSGSRMRTSHHGGSSMPMADEVTAVDSGYVLATGLTSLGDASLVVADYGADCVCLCDADGHAEHRVTGLKPFSVATSTSSLIDDDQLIYVGDRRRKTLLALDRHGSDVAQWPDNQFDWICGIACLPDGHLAVLDRSHTRQLGIYSTGGGDGQPVTELGGQGSSVGDLCMAQFVAADSRGRILVSDSGNHCVKAFDRRVRAPGVVAVYGTTRGRGEAQLEWPKGIAVDSADNLLVADCRNGRVVAFAVDGRPLGCVGPAVRGPFAVCAVPTLSGHPRRRLAVTTYSIIGLSEFRLYEYDTGEIFV